MGSQCPKECPQNAAASDLPQQDDTWNNVNEVLQDLGASVGASTMEGKGSGAWQEGLDSAKEKEDHPKVDNAESTEERQGVSGEGKRVPEVTDLEGGDFVADKIPEFMFTAHSSVPKKVPQGGDANDRTNVKDAKDKVGDEKSVGATNMTSNEKSAEAEAKVDSGRRADADKALGDECAGAHRPGGDECAGAHKAGGDKCAGDKEMVAATKENASGGDKDLDVSDKSDGDEDKAAEPVKDAGDCSDTITLSELFCLRGKKRPVCRDQKPRACKA